jgi:hypothetical protein
MKVSLRSTWREYYDNYFDPPSDDAVVFDRTGGHTGPPKRDQFRLLEEAGFQTPPHGLVGDVMNRSWPEEYQDSVGGPSWAPINLVVVYDDETAHCAEGKRLLRKCQITSNPHMGMPGGDRYWREKQLYCSAYVHPKGYRGVPVEKAESLRLLQVGPHTFYLLYTSEASWMSNDGEGDVDLVDYRLNAGFHPVVKKPLWAVDFAPGRAGLYAVDFNVAPGMRGTGVNRVLGGAQVVDAVRAFYEAHPEVR